MLDQSLIKSNFIGRDGFVWWIGQIPPEKNHRNQINGGGWSHRYKVRILGYDSPESSTLPDDDLRWAQVMLPTTAGSGGANQSTSVAISPGDIVFGFFLDGTDLNVPIILGVLPRTSEVSSNQYNAPFQPYTGYTTKVDNDGAYIVKNESNENNINAQKSPRIVSPRQAKKIGEDERSAFSGVGDVIKAASGSSATTVQKMSTEIDNFVNRIQTITDKVSGAVGSVKELIDAEIAKVTEKIQKISSGLINDLMNNTYRSLASTLNQGLILVGKTVLDATGSVEAAKKAQEAFVPGVKAIQNALPCITNTILSAIGDTVNGLLQSVAENVTNFVGCVANQFIGGLLNHIIDITDTILTPLISAVNPIRLGFEVVDFLRSNAESLLSPRNNISCSEVKPSYVTAPANKWTIGKGPNDQPGVPITSIIESANTAALLAQSAIDSVGNVVGAVNDLSSVTGSLDLLKKDFSVAGFKGAVSDCFGGFPSNCGGTQVKIFGGRGKGAVAKAIMGSIVGQGASATGSIIGFDILNGGSGYDFPPFVEIVDNCKQGRGAIARSVVKNGKVVDIYVVSEGENYPIDAPEQIIDPRIVDNVIVVDGGSNYEPGDEIFDENNPDIKYQPKILDGVIVEVLKINTDITNLVEVKDLPNLKVRSKKGYGAILKARLKAKETYQGEVKQQIDCIS